MRETTLDCSKFQQTWKQASFRKKSWIFLGIYSFLFLITVVFSYLPFFHNGISFIWFEDGAKQHYPTLIYTGQYLRRLLSSLFHGNFALPLFDFNIGMGADILTTLNYYGFGDPLNLLSVFVPMQYTEYLYNFLVIFRLYLAGLAFCALCRHHRKRACHALIGSFIYVFSGYALFSGVRHPFFINPMIQLPLLLIGIDLIMKKKKKSVFIFSVFYSALCGFYFLYMMTIVLGFYALVKFSEYYPSKRIHHFFLMIRQIAGSYLLGIGLAAPLFFPAVYGFLSSSRFGQSVNFHSFFYKWDYYKFLFPQTIAPAADWDYLSLAAIMLLAVSLFFYSRKLELLPLKRLFFLAVLTYIFPLGGHIMNGLGYCSQRWTFAFALLLSYIVVEMLPELLNPTRKQKSLYLGVLFIYIASIIIGFGSPDLYFAVGILILTITVLICTRFSADAAFKVTPYLKEFTCLILVIFNVSINAFYLFAEDGANYIAEFSEYGFETTQLENSLEHDAKQSLTDLSAHYDSTSFITNAGTLLQVPTFNTYWSMFNRYVSNFNIALENCAQRFSFYISGIDNRASLTSLLSTNYFIDRPENKAYIPYGYDFFQKTAEGNLIYQNKYALPLGYTYDTWIPYAELEELNGLQTQAAMLQTIALEKPPKAFQRGAINNIIQDIPYEIFKSNGLEWSNGIMHVKENNATLTLECQFPKNTEKYLRLENFDINSSDLSYFQIGVETSDIHKEALCSSAQLNFYYGRKNYLFNLGSSSIDKTRCTITFPEKGDFLLSKIEFLAYPLDGYPAQMETLREASLENIVLDTNQISGTLCLSADKILCMNIPYSRGWSAKVDGKPVGILRGNIMFMALPLEKGYHEIEFTYCTPGFRIGLLCAFVTLIILACMKRRRK